MTNVVIVNVSQLQPPAPSTLQRTGAFLSQGATTAAQGSLTLLTNSTALTGILKGAGAITSITWAGGVATVTTQLPHGFTITDELYITIAGASPTGYNAAIVFCTVTGASTFTYPLASNPGSSSSSGTYTVEDATELVQMNTTFWSQGNGISVYVLELGAGNPVDGVTYLASWITANPGVIYAYLPPRTWDSNSSVLSFYGSLTSTTSKTYFHQTTTTSTYVNYPASMKSVIATVESPTNLPATEFSAAADFWVTLNQNPSSANRATPNAYAFLENVTPFPTQGNSAILTTLAAANINVVGTAQEGGLSNLIELYGTTKDGNDFLYWYAVDWVQVNIDLNVANAIFNGSNNKTNPLIYNQFGINSLQRVAATTLGNGVTYGLINGQVVQTQLVAADLIAALDAGTYDGLTLINAQPFVPYGQANPNDYAAGIYQGFTIVFVPARGFRQVVFNVVVTNFIAP
jgi:hypothetical protein